MKQASKTRIPLSKGMIINAKVTFCTFLRHLKPTDQGLEKIDLKETYNLGTKELLPRTKKDAERVGIPICITDFSSVRDRVRYVLEQNSFTDGLVTFVPYSLVPETIHEIVEAEKRLMEAKAILLDNYEEIKAKWTAAHPEIKASEYPSVEYLRRRIKLDWVAVEFNVPQGMEAKIMESEALDELLSSSRERDALVSRVREKTQKMVASFADACAVQLAERCADSARKLYEAIVNAGPTGRLNGRALRAFDEAAKRLSKLNWMENETIQSLLDEASLLVTQTGLITLDVASHKEHLAKLEESLRKIMEMAGKAHEVASVGLEEAAKEIRQGKVEPKADDPRNLGDRTRNPGKKAIVRGLLARKAA